MYRSMVSGCCSTPRNCWFPSNGSRGSERQRSSNCPTCGGQPRITCTGRNAMPICRSSRSATRRPFRSSRSSRSEPGHKGLGGTCASPDEPLFRQQRTRHGVRQHFRQIGPAAVNAISQIAAEAMQLAVMAAMLGGLGFGPGAGKPQGFKQGNSGLPPARFRPTIAVTDQRPPLPESPA